VLLDDKLLMPESKMSLQLTLGYVFLIGLCMPIQAAANAELSKYLPHPIWGAFISLLCSASLLIPLILLLKPEMPNWSAFNQVPWWALTGGFIGAIYVSSAILVAPQIGFVTFMVLIIFGQLAGSSLIDHHGLLNAAQKELTFTRVTGICIVLMGVFICVFSNQINSILGRTN